MTAAAARGPLVEAAKAAILHELAGLRDEVRDEVQDLAAELEGAAAAIAADVARVVAEGADPAKLRELKAQAGLLLEARRIRLATKARKRLERGLEVLVQVMATVLSAGLRGAVAGL